MKVKTKLGLAAVLPIVVALAVCAIMFQMFSLVDQLSVALKSSEDIIAGIFNLQGATYRYAADPGETTSTTWHAEHQKLHDTLANARLISLTTPFSFIAPLNFNKLLDDKGLRTDLRELHQKTHLDFMAIQPPAAAPASTSSAPATDAILADIHNMMERALTLSQITSFGASAVQSTAYMLVVIATMFLAGVLALLSWMASVKISRAVNELRNGMSALAGGDFTHVVDIRSLDELGSLARDFNRMSAYMAEARHALASEIEDHKKTMLTLNTANRKLSDSLLRLERAQQQAIQQERMQVLKQIAYGVVHDFNSALTPVIGITEYLLSAADQLQDPKELQESLQVIYESAQKGRNIIKSLVDYFNPVAWKSGEKADINKVVAKAVELTGPRWKSAAKNGGAPITVSITPSATPLMVDGSAAEFEEVMVNLIVNAVQAMPSGGTISISSSTDGGHALLEVSDTGEGMHPDVRARCFEPFFSTKTEDASGMGLTAAKVIVNRYRGTIELDSDEGKGTRIQIRIPLETVQVAPLPVTSGKSGLKVLAIDDEAWVYKSIEKYLTTAGYAVTVAVNGTDGLKKYAGDRFALVIVDRAMPDMSGDTVAAEIDKLSGGKTPVIMLTAFADLMRERGEKPHGVHMIIGKPCTRQELLSAISTLRVA